MNPSPLAADCEHILGITGASLWEHLRGERVFVTGGTGFVGTWLLEAFVAADRRFGLKARAVVVTRDPDRFRARAPHLAEAGAVGLVTGDASTFEFPSGTFAFVIHAATERWFDADARRPLSILIPDLTATRRVLDFAASHGTRRLLFTSSGAVYGSGASALDRVSEEFFGAPDVTLPRAAYGESKRVSEFACASYARAYGFDTVLARLFAFVGPHLPLDEGYAVGNFIADVLAERAIAIAGDGTPHRSYLYAADLAIWLWTMLFRGEGGRAYNVGSPHAISIAELALTVAATLRPQTPVTIARAPVAGAAPSNYVPDATRAQRELGLQVQIDLAEALRRTYAFHRSTRRTTTTP